MLATAIEWRHVFYDADVRSLGITRHWNEPQFYFELDNSFTFPDGWFLNVNGNISTAAKQSYSLIHREGTVNARLSKSFLEDALMITLTADDIFIPVIIIWMDMESEVIY